MQNEENQKIKKLLDLLPEGEKTQNVINVLTKYLKNYDFDYIASQIEYVKKQKPNNFIAYLKKAIRDNYVDIEKEKLQETKRQKTIEKRIEELKNKMEEEVKLAVEKEQVLIYKEYMDLLDENSRNELLNKYYSKVAESNPNMANKKHLMGLNIKILIIQDIIAKNEIYKLRLENIRLEARKKAQKDFEDSKRKLYVSVENN